MSYGHETPRGDAMKPVWIVDDDRSIRWVLEKALAREGIPYKTFASAYEVLQALAVSQPQVLVSDIRMPGESGLVLLNKMKERYPHIPVIIMTAYSDLDSAVAAFQGGAFEYLPKPFDVDHALALIRRAIAETPATRAGRPARRWPRRRKCSGQAPAMQEVFRAIGRLSQSNATVLITGESGHRQGAGRPRAAPAQPARGGAVRRDQHRGDSEGPARVRAVRARARRVHRRAGARAAGASSRPKAARCSSTRSATCRPTCRCACCACSPTASTTASAATRR